MKKIIILTLFLLINSISAFAAENYLNTVQLEGINEGYNIILRSDSAAKVRKTVQSDDKIILEIKGILPSPDMNTVYRNTSDVNGLIVENSGNNTVKIYVKAKDIAKANIIFDTPASPPIIVADEISADKILWAVTAFVFISAVIAGTKSLQDNPAPAIQRDIKSREVELYRNFSRELAKMPSINYKIKHSKYSYNPVSTRETLREYKHLSRL